MDRGHRDCHRWTEKGNRPLSRPSYFQALSREVVNRGSGNSAGQAAMFLSRYA
jgi:hypothetical protein